MKAKARYRLIVRKGSHTPALANPDRVDHVEVVDVDDGEAVFYWDLTAADARRVVRALREDLDRLDAREFFEAWASFEGGEDLHRQAFDPRGRTTFETFRGFWPEQTDDPTGVSDYPAGDR